MSLDSKRFFCYFYNNFSHSFLQDYIQMYLGELSPIQESRLVQLKGCISNLQKGKVPSDPILLRFLRARDFNVEKAREMLSQSLLWRKKHGVDKILSEYELPEVVKRYFPGAFLPSLKKRKVGLLSIQLFYIKPILLGGWHMSDNEERPLFILRLGQVDVKGIIKVNFHLGFFLLFFTRNHYLCIFYSLLERKV